LRNFEKLKTKNRAINRRNRAINQKAVGLLFSIQNLNLRLKNPSIEKPTSFFLENQTVLDFFLKFRKLNFILETDQFFRFCRFQQVPRSIIAGPGVIVAGGIGRCYRIRSVPSVKNMARSRCPAISPFTPTTTAPRRRRCPPARNQPAYHHEMVARWIGIAAALHCPATLLPGPESAGPLYVKPD
jgi:hypothetical protein